MREYYDQDAAAYYEDMAAAEAAEYEASLAAEAEAQQQYEAEREAASVNAEPADGLARRLPGVGAEPGTAHAAAGAGRGLQED